MKVKIQFKDEGQDFLTWIVDTLSGRILDSTPYNQCWKNGTVKLGFQVGGFVEFRRYRCSTWHLIRYQIISISMVP